MNKCLDADKKPSKSTLKRWAAEEPRFYRAEGWLLLLEAFLFLNLIGFGFLLYEKAKKIIGLTRYEFGELHVGGFYKTDIGMMMFTLDVVIWICAAFGILYLYISFMTNDKKFPKLFVIYFSSLSVAFFGFGILVMFASGSTTAFQRLLYSVPPLLVWVPYLAVSKRVKATFWRG